MPMLETLNLSEVNIVASGSHPANAVPEAAFYKEIYNSDGYTLALKTVYLPNSCTIIGANAFMYCSKLEEVHIPKNVSNINYNAFSVVEVCTMFMSIIRYHIILIGAYLRI